MKMEQRLVDAGYVKSPNNVYGISGDIWYTGGPGVFKPEFGLEIQVCDGAINVFRGHVTKHCDCFIEIIHRFTTVETFLNWIKENGRPSLGGVSYANNWD